MTQSEAGCTLARYRKREVNKNINKSEVNNALADSPQILRLLESW